ncbi:hypothetical protein, partial [Streptomyces sp. NPDC058964]|uniref:hypothetical protein n=1 Tax=Streptomyces sp. NPDC058964 TaxID=3346681 RepID=UPI0036851D30
PPAWGSAMNADPTEDRTVRYADEITLADGMAIEQFINARLEPHVEEAEGNQDKWATAYGLACLVTDIRMFLEIELNLRAKNPESLVHRRGVRREWNRLADLASGWKGLHDDFDHDRWRRTPFLDAEEEAAWEANRARIIERAGRSEDDPTPGEEA